MTMYILLFYYLIFSLIHEGISHRPWYSEECQAWVPIIKHIQQEDPKLQVTCNKNEECTGIQCSGKYIYTGIITFGKTFETDICFGMSVMPCDEPVDLSVYVVVPQYKKRVERVVKGSERFKIKGLEIPVSKEAVAVPYISVDMNRTSDPKRMMRLHMRLEVEIRQKYSKGKPGKGTHVHELEIDLVPGSIIPIPDCDKHVINPSKAPASCDVGVVKNKKPDSKPVPKLVPQRRTKPKAKTKAKTKATSLLPGTKCKGKPDSLLACGNYEYCTFQNVCVCLARYKYDNTTRSCVDPTNTTPVPSPTSQPLSTSIKLIASCGVVAGVILVIIVALIVVYKYRKRRSRYQHHDMLLNNDDDDDDDVDPIT